MNIKRGLFRLWLVLSVIFAGLVFLMTWSSIVVEFERASFAAQIAKDTSLVPVLCGQARGTANVDYTGEKIPTDPNPYDTCWYELPKLRALYPEYANLSDGALSDRLYRSMNILINRAPSPHPWNYLMRIIAVAFGFPLIVLAIGYGFVWAVSGFSGRQKAS